MWDFNSAKLFIPVVTIKQFFLLWKNTSHHDFSVFIEISLNAN